MHTPLITLANLTFWTNEEEKRKDINERMPESQAGIGG